MKRYQLRIDWELYQYDKLGEFNSLDEAAAWIESLSYSCRVRYCPHVTCWYTMGVALS